MVRSSCEVNGAGRLVPPPPRHGTEQPAGDPTRCIQKAELAACSETLNGSGRATDGQTFAAEDTLTTKHNGEVKQMLSQGHIFTKYNRKTLFDVNFMFLSDGLLAKVR